MTENDHHTTGNANATGNVVLTIIAIVAILAIAFYAIQFLRPADANDVNINLPNVDIIPESGDTDGTL